ASVQPIRTGSDCACAAPAARPRLPAAIAAQAAIRFKLFIISSLSCDFATTSLILDGVAQDADLVDFHFDHIALLHEDRRLAGETHTGGRAGDDHVAGLQDRKSVV